MNKLYKSPLCSCILCKKVYSTKGIHSHYLTTHDPIYRQSHILRAVVFSSSNINKKPNKLVILKNAKIDDYNNNPKLCIICNNKVPYNMSKKDVCSKSCSAKNGNQKRILAGYTISDENKKRMRDIAITRGARGKRVTPIKLCAFCNNWFESRSHQTCSVTCKKQLLSKYAFERKLGHNGQRSGKLTMMEDSFKRVVRLESSYELKMANILNSLKIKWTRPSPLYYTDNEQKLHRYYPDFYLSDFDIYLDPKNKYLITLDQDKINRAAIQNNVQIVIIPKDDINQEFILNLVKPQFCS